ncbi:MAG: TatD family hydrolase [Thermoplasmata archaeon]
MHLQRQGGCTDSVKKFRRAGGTHLVLSHMPYYDMRDWDVKGYAPIYDRTLRMAEEARQGTDVKVFVTLGPYPVDMLALKEGVGLKKAEDILMGGMDLAGKCVEEGKAVALGEIGRPHFEVSEEVMDASNRVMLYGMELAADLSCPVILHTESTTPEVCREIAGMADEAGLPRDKVVKHYSPPMILEKENHGLFPSVLASEKNLRAALEKGDRFVMETDYLDDPARPGAVLGIKTVPKKTFKLHEGGALTEKNWQRIHIQNPSKLYDIDVEL